MDFNSTTALIGLGILMVCLAPIIWLHWSSGKKNKIWLNTYREAARQACITLSECDTWNNQYGLGLDGEQKKLLYAHASGTGLKTVQLKLSAIRKCALTKEMDGSNVDKIYLTIRQNKKPELHLELYNSDLYPNVTDEYELGNKWVQRLEGLRTA